VHSKPVVLYYDFNDITMDKGEIRHKNIHFHKTSERHLYFLIRRRILYFYKT
jgi:hypothetical protein